MTVETILIICAVVVIIASGVGGVICDLISCNAEITKKRSDILRIASKVFRLLSIAIIVALVLGVFIAFGFDLHALAGFAIVVVLRAVSMVMVALWGGHDANPLPKWFDAAMYEALVAGMLAPPIMIIGVFITLLQSL